MELNRSALEGIREHVLKEHPREACGLIVKGNFIACDNIHEEPEDNFRIDPKEIARYSKRGLQAVVHSHTRHITEAPIGDPRAPSKNDMIGQRNTGVPWAIFSTEGETVSEPLWIGETRASTFHDLISRPFIHGVNDCYSLIRDYYRIEHGIELKDYPRDNQWWNNGGNLYLDHFAEVGFKPIPIEKLKPGDGLLMCIRSPVPNHAAIYLGGDEILHHLQERLSGRDSLAKWRAFVTHAMRYVGDNSC